MLAKYSDGSVRDVTRLALYMTNNEAIAAIGKDGVVNGGGRGGAFVFARFGKFTVGSEVIVLPTDDKFAWPNPPEHNYIDTLVFDKLKKLHLAPSDLCSDEAFLRRVYLDLIGLPPSRDEYDAFLADKDAEEAREADRRAAGAARVRRHVDDEVGRTAPHPGVQPACRNTAATRRRCSPTPRG